MVNGSGIECYQARYHEFNVDNAQAKHLLLHNLIHDCQYGFSHAHFTDDLAFLIWSSSSLFGDFNEMLKYLLQHIKNS